MNWVYERAVRHKGLNYHLWSTEGSERGYAITRASVIPPQDSRVYRSLQELAERTGVPVVPLERNLSAENGPVATRFAIGLYRRDDGWVQVDYGNTQIPIPPELYEKNGYEPGFDHLMTETKYRTFQEVAARRKGA